MAPMAQEISMASTQRSSWKLTRFSGASDSLPRQRAGADKVLGMYVSSNCLMSNEVQETQIVISMAVQKKAMETTLMTMTLHLPTQSGTMPQARPGSVSSQGKSPRDKQWARSRYQMTLAETRVHLANVFVANPPALLLRGLDQDRR
jgi:hypothetical protein